jgi:hypothetical protein
MGGKKGKLSLIFAISNSVTFLEHKYPMNRRICIILSRVSDYTRGFDW